ncbi:chemotaxis response regulator protein-glutamate methylesterase [Nitrogeniibacter mangrovi]|uniref:Protein-glutamate methylesterase/protein-glutamine glutaminase n=1 Tax=Nitrogeniibacter mangrovi TaxID=2016596 RepID=A0A6C1B3N8_9RHOO|nr:chemotaxis response regulator protein-glutamate methylesterase [Nitrogeniibacter mangrovi]QID18272.1 chemotaxis response regulator protein-glutamate methylesterase [Nitrogeniibacter mangrovi]
MTIKVLICDDSALIRAMLKAVVDSQPDMTVVGLAPDPLVARDMIKATNPDVMTLDIEMPKMDGLDFLERVMRLRPMPVVMVSTLTALGSEATIRALELGAVDFVAKPRASNTAAFEASAKEICDKIRTACRARIGRSNPSTPASGDTLGALPPQVVASRLICLGASTGGTEAIRQVLTRLPAQCPPVLMVQHMPEMFTGSFAKRLDSLCALSVKEAEHGEPVLPGHAYLAPGHSHLLLAKRGGRYVCELSGAEPVNRHRPSVDVLFHSAARLAGRAAVGALLTGMGKDGAQGMLAMREAGSWTVAQDEASCVVYGMPREAARIGAAQEVAPLDEIASRLVNALAHGGALRASGQR